MYSWYFPSTDGGQRNGINHAGIETFSGSPLKSLAREICQNSLDAVRDTDQPCKLEFSFFQIPTEKIPGYTEVFTTIKDMERFWKKSTDPKIKNFLEKAKKVLNGKEVSVARISDFNTTGLSGADTDEITSKWASLVLAAGVSNKEKGAGGSFGIGKSAPFACSDLHMVFYSSLDESGVEASQGVLTLASFTPANQGDDVKQGLGYFGVGKNGPILELLSIDPTYERTTTGTDIYIFGFKDEGYDRQERNATIIASVIDGFFYAIWKNKMVIDVDGIVVDSSNLYELSLKYREQLSEAAYDFIPILTEDTVHEFRNDNFMNMGPIKLLLREANGSQRKIARIRNNGMKIDNYVPRILIGRDYAGIFISEGDKINNFLRHLEGPMHTKWEPARSQKPRYAGQVIGQINKFISESIKQLIVQNEEEILEVDLGDILPDLLAEDIKRTEKENRTEAIVDTLVKIDSKRIKLSKQRSSSIGGNVSTKSQADETGDEDHGSGFIRGGEGSTNPGEKDPTAGGQEGEEPTKIKDVDISIIDARVICPDSSKGIYYFSFMPARDATNVKLQVFEAAETNAVVADVIFANANGRELDLINRNTISIPEVHANVLTKIQVKIDMDDYCAMEFRLNGQLS